MKTLAAHLRYFVSDAADEWRRSPGPNVLATATIAAVLFVAGLNMLLLANLAANVGRWKNDLRVSVYLADGATGPDVESLQGRLGALPGVARVDIVDKAEALRRFRASFPALADLPADLGTNPLPASLEVVLRPGPPARESAAAVTDLVAKNPAVEEVRYDQAFLERVESLLGIARWGGTALGALVFTAVAFVVAAVLRLTVYARQDEIDIMLLVGASRGFVRGPFLVAGLAQGLGGGVAALGLVEIARRAALSRGGSHQGDLLALVAGNTLPSRPALGLVAAGAALGLVSAWFAVRETRDRPA